MSAETRHGGGIKITKITKSLFGFVVFVTFVVIVPRPSGVSGQALQPPQRPPVFRAGANYVRVDAYPTLGGEILPHLTKDDFEIFEDGKPQTIAAAEFVTFGEPDVVFRRKIEFPRFAPAAEDLVVHGGVADGRFGMRHVGDGQQQRAH